MMFIVSIKFSKHVQNEISAKVMPKPQNFTADFADEMKLSKATVSRLAKHYNNVDLSRFSSGIIVLERNQ